MAYRQQMIDLVRSGRSPESLEQEFEPSATTIRQWMMQEAREEASAEAEGPLTADERDELRRLRRENRSLREEREILKKATAWFAQEATSSPKRGSNS